MRKAFLVIGVLLLAAAGWWIYRNASVHRLRAEFRPWMARLERWRDANEAVRRALRSREAAPADPVGIAALRSWAWNGLDRLAYADYRVERPRHRGEETSGPVTFTVGGFATDGSRVERSARAFVSQGSRVSVRFERGLAERREPSPRFHDATAGSGLGAPRHDPPLKLVNRLIADIWPGSGVAVLDLSLIHI